MGIGKTNAAGGGASLNFDVKAYATKEALLAAVPKENAIGVITTTPIAGWIFSSAEPAETVGGMVWFPTGASSAVEFNALKKNAIQVYPMSAKQYVGGAWVSVPAYSYQDGEWTEWWSGQLFSPGNQWESVTGGWEVIGFSSNSAWNAKAPSISMDSTMELTLKAESKNTICSGVAISKKRINLAEANILSVDASSVSLNSASSYKSGAKLCILSTNDITKHLDDITVASAAIRQETSAFTETNIRIELDVSALDGEYFVAIFLGIGGNTSTNCTVKASISDITLEQ